MAVGDNPLETKPVGKLLLTLSIPSILAQLVSILYNIVDRIYIGHIADQGLATLSGVGVVAPILIVINSFANLIGMGGAPLSSIALGKKDNKLANQILWNCILTTVVISLGIASFLLIFKEQVLNFFGTNPEIYQFADEYFTIICIGILFSTSSTVLNQFLLTQGKNKISMIIVMGGSILNIILDPVFIFGLHMGIKGAALVTVFCQVCTTIASLMFYLLGSSTLKILPSRFEIKIIANVISLGFATFFMNITEGLIITVFNKQLIKYGSVDYVAVLSIIFSINQIITSANQGINQGAQPIISYNFGAGNYKRLKTIINYCLHINTYTGFFLTVILEIFAPFFLSLFTNDQKLIQMGVTPLRIFIAGRTFSGIQFAIQNTLRATGEAVRPILIAMFRKLVLIVPLAYLLPVITHGGTNAVFMAEPISDVIAQIFASLIFLLFYKKHIKNK